MGDALSHEPFLTFICIVLSLALLISFIRLFLGPTLFDRMVALGVISSKTMILVALVGFLFRRPSMFIDIVLAYSLLNYVGTLAIARYLERRGGMT